MTTARTSFDLYLTNEHKDGRPVFGEKPTFRGTRKKIINMVSEYRRISGGCDIGIRIINRKTGLPIRWNAFVEMA